MTAAVDIHVEIADCPISRFHWRLGALLALVLFFDGYDLFNGAYVAPYVKAEWRLGPVELGTLLSAGIVGLALGSLAVGYFADRFGRRPMLITSLWLVSIGSVLLATVVNSFSVFLVVRLLLGTGLGMLTPIALTYLNEWAPRRAANRFATSIFIVGFAGGGLSAGVIALLLAPSYGWRAIYWVGALSIFVTVMCQVWLPESIRYLAATRRVDAVRRALGRFRPERSAIYADASAFENSAIAADVPVARIWPALRSRNTATLWIVGALSLFVIHGLTNWLPTVMINRGTSVHAAFLLGILIMVMQVCGGLATAQFADWSGNRKAVMSVFFFLGGGAMLAFGAGPDFRTMTVLVAVAAFAIFGAQAIFNNFTALSYETSVRTTGTGIAVGVARIGGILGPFIIGLVQKMGGSFFAIFALFCICLVLAGGLILLAAPELDAAGGASPE